MAYLNEVLKGQSKETIQGILTVWKMIQTSPTPDFTKEEADDMVKFLTNELQSK